MIPPVTARAALAQSLFYDREKAALAAASVATLLYQPGRQHDIAVRRLERCLCQIRTLERWQEGQKQAYNHVDSHG